MQGNAVKRVTDPAWPPAPHSGGRATEQAMEVRRVTQPDFHAISGSSAWRLGGSQTQPGHPRRWRRERENEKREEGKEREGENTHHVTERHCN